LVTSRRLDRAEQACQEMQARFGVDLTPVEAPNSDAAGRIVEQAQIVFATGAAGVELLQPRHWQDNPNIEVLVDANATPPVGIGGIDLMDRGALRNGKIAWGAIGFGAFKLALHRACIAKLFESNDLVLDAEEVMAIAKSML